jgi:2-phospho-L-lactate guanylyltransferase
VKRFADAKARLAGEIEPERRRTLAAAMLEDVLESIGRSRRITGTIVVSGDPDATRLGAACGAEVVDDPTDESHSAAALLGIEAAVSAGTSSVILLPGDCPLLEPRELDRLLATLPEPCVTVVPDRHGTGTNALVVAPPDAIRPAFGEGSLRRHVEAARAAGVPHTVEEVGSLALDLDTPADVVALSMELEFRRGDAPRTARALGIRKR